MFGLFKITPTPNYIVYLTEIDKYRYLINWVNISLDRHILVYHFDNTCNEVEQLLSVAKVDFSKDLDSESKVLLTDSETLLKGNWPMDYWVIVLEIYPLSARAQGLMKRAKENSHSLEFYTAIDSPFFKLFGGERITAVMQNLNIDSEESLSHPMINKSIQKTQKMVEKKLQLEVREQESIERWIEVNKIDRL